MLNSMAIMHFDCLDPPQLFSDIVGLIMHVHKESLGLMFGFVIVSLALEHVFSQLNAILHLKIGLRLRLRTLLML